MKVWLVNSYEPIPIDPRGRDRLHRMGSIAEHCAARGHAVTWWTSTFNHARKEHYHDEDSILNLYPGLEVRMMHVRGYDRNVSIARVRHQIALASRFSGWARHESKRPDIIVASYPPIELAYESMMYGREHRIPVIIDIRDMWPDAIVRLAPKAIRPMAKVILLPMHFKARAACAGASSIMGITDQFVDWGLDMGQRSKSPLDRAFPFSYSVIPPSDDAIQRAELFWDELGIRRSESDFTICYFGNIGRHAGLNAIIKAARILKERAKPVRFVLCGSGEKVDEYRRIASDLANVILPGWVGPAEIHVLMCRSSAGIDPLPETEDFLNTINNKAVEYLSGGLPLLVSPDKGVLHTLVNDNNCGLSYPYSDGEALAEAVEHLLDTPDLRNRMAQNALELFNKAFSPDVVYGNMLDYLEGVVARYRGE